MAGLVKGGIGSASIDLGGGLIIGALVAVNSVGSALMPDGITYWAWPFELNGEFGSSNPPGAQADMGNPAPDESRLLAQERLRPGANTTLGVMVMGRLRLRPPVIGEAANLPIVAGAVMDT